MGGSGGNSSFGGLGPRGTRGREDISCESLRFRTAIVNPDVAVLQQIVVGQILSVVLHRGSQSLQVIDAKGQILGSLLPNEIGRLVQCINASTTYEAKVMTLDPPKCMVEVYAA